MTSNRFQPLVFPYRITSAMRLAPTPLDRAWTQGYVGELVALLRQQQDEVRERNRQIV